MRFLKEVMKTKRLQKLSDSFVMIIPELWIRAMDWNRENKFVLELQPFHKQIVITDIGKEISNVVAE